MFVAGGRHVDRSAERAQTPRDFFDRPAVGVNAAVNSSEEHHVAVAAAALGDRHACRRRVLDALETLMQFDSDPGLRREVRSRYLDLTRDAA